MPEAFNLLAASHISLCDTCRATAESYDVLGGALLADTDVSVMVTTSLEDTIARLDAVPQKTKSAPRTAGTLPTPLQDYVGGDLDAIQWRPVGMGVKQAVLKTSSAATARLLLIPAGACMPDHSHKGTEMTLVLKGAFDDADGHFARGDVDVANDTVTHTPVACAQEDCICLAVTEAPLRFRAWLPRIVQKFVRI